MRCCRLTVDVTGGAMKREEWAAGTSVEFGFWKRWLETKGAQWPADYDFRTDPNAELQSDIAQHIEDFPGTTLKLLDVGAGPMTAVGKRYRGAPIDLTAVDALADQYDAFDFPPGLPLVRTLQCDSEALSRKFGEDAFDIVYARNTLDHGYDPIEAIREMLKVARPGGKVIAAHLSKEATAENWTGFHQWNFYVDADGFKIANRSSTFALADAIAAHGRIVFLSPPGDTMANFVISKF